MYLPIQSQPDCAAAWRAAVAGVDAQQGDSAYNVVIDVTNPLAGASLFAGSDHAVVCQKGLETPSPKQLSPKGRVARLPAAAAPTTAL